jgi:hypothetical protein
MPRPSPHALLMSNDGLRLTKVKARRPVAYIIEYTTPPKR